MLHAVLEYVDATIAWIFGLDQSKYQWAIERHRQQLEQVNVGPNTAFTHQTTVA